MAYAAPDQNSLARDQSVYFSSFTLPSQAIYAPKELSDATLLPVVARNQPAVVRIGTQRCGTITIAASTPVTIDRACNAEIGSGSISFKQRVHSYQRT